MSSSAFKPALIESTRHSRSAAGTPWGPRVVGHGHLADFGGDFYSFKAGTRLKSSPNRLMNPIGKSQVSLYSRTTDFELCHEPRRLLPQQRVAGLTASIRWRSTTALLLHPSMPPYAAFQPVHKPRRSFGRSGEHGICSTAAATGRPAQTAAPAGGVGGLGELGTSKQASSYIYNRYLLFFKEIENNVPNSPFFCKTFIDRLVAGGVC